MDPISFATGVVTPFAKMAIGGAGSKPPAPKISMPTDKPSMITQNTPPNLNFNKPQLNVSPQSFAMDRLRG